MFLEYLLLSMVFIVVIWVRLKWKKTAKYWADRGVPFAPPHPIVGSLTFLLRENPAFWLRRLQNQFKGPYVGIWLFWKPALVVQCPEIARNILVKDSDNFRNRYLNSGKSDAIGSLNIFMLKDPEWSALRRRLTPVFTAAKLRSMEGLIKSKTTDLVDRLISEAEKSKQVNVRVICADFTTDVIGEAAFGVSSAATRTGDSVMRQVTRELMRFTVFRGMSWTSIFFWPSLVDIFGFRLFERHTILLLRRIFLSAVQQRGGFERVVSQPRDFLDALVKIKQDARADHEDVSEDSLLAQAAVLVQAGFDASGAVLAWTLVELAHRPHVQEKLYNELIEARVKLGRDLDAAVLAEIPYLNAVIKETLRKYPPMSWLDRIAAEDYCVDNKLTIAAGTVVYVNAHGMMRDPRYFPDPDEYNPDRFMPHFEHNIPPYAFIPFGEGPRICIGMRLAYEMLRSSLAAICLRLHIKPPTPHSSAGDYPVNNMHMFLMPGDTVNLIIDTRAL